MSLETILLPLRASLLYKAFWTTFHIPPLCWFFGADFVLEQFPCFFFRCAPPVLTTAISTPECLTRLLSIPRSLCSKDENAEWNTGSAKGSCIRRFESRGFPKEMIAMAEASDRFFERGVYYRNPLDVSSFARTPEKRNNSVFSLAILRQYSFS